MTAPLLTIDGNEAAARVAHLLSEVIAIYPITPASPMGEAADAWSDAGQPNKWGMVPRVIEMQSEAGAAGAVHGSLQAGALTTTFTASQGLLLMIPNLYKIAGELTPAVIHVAARSVATHALSIFGDHSDVMAARQTGMAMLASGSVQEAQDLALVAHASTLRTRVPFIHFFDGFRTSHEVAKIEGLTAEAIDALIDDELIREHRLRALHPEHPVIRGTAQNPDVFFQAREAANPFHLAVPDMVEADLDRLADATGRRYHVFDYVGAPDAERVVVVMGSGAGPCQEWVEATVAGGEKVGVVVVRLYRPFDAARFAAILPETVTSIAVLDRTKEPGSVGEPLYTDVVAALVEQRKGPLPTVIGGRYGLSSKEFTPAMVAAVFDELSSPEPRRHVTIGIVDDVTHSSLRVDRDSWTEPDSVVRAVFFGMGSDGTVGANKNSVKIIGELTPNFAQGYFVYDSKKSGSMTESHLRFGPDPIRSSYLIDEADFVGCHQWNLLERIDVLARARKGATILLNTSHTAEDVYGQLPARVKQALVDKDLDLWIVDADRIATEAGLGRRVNTVLQACFFALTPVMETDDAITAIKDTITKTYSRHGAVVLERNMAAVDGALAGLARAVVPERDGGGTAEPERVPAAAPEFVREFTVPLLEGRGDLLPVSALPVDGTFPSATSQWEKRRIASEIPIWDPDICIDCGRCALVCPHAAIRMKVAAESSLAQAPAGFRSKPWKGPEGDVMIIQVAPEDCTGCGVCVEICPAKSKTEVRHKSINMTPIGDHLDRERTNFEFFIDLPESDRSELKLGSVKGSQLAQPLFEFSGACSGCGETPYLKLLSQLFGDRIIVANATGCSSIYGGNLPTTPWSVNGEGRGPAWANSLFEDNAEFGLGMRLALDHHQRRATELVARLENQLGPLATEILEADQSDESGVIDQRARVDELEARLADIDGPVASELTDLADHLVKSGVWIVGGDGWAYDIGFGGLDHVLASGEDVNVLVLDTEVYSNTGGQTSKATPRSAVAKFSAGGKTTAKKDLGMIAMAYADVYVAQVAMGANMTQVVKAFQEAEAHPGPSLIIAYSPCIAHGIDMTQMMGRQKLAAETGYWPLYRFDPSREEHGDHALHLDSRPPTVKFADFALGENRFALLARSEPEVAEALFEEAQHDIDNRWHLYEQMVEVERTARYSDITDDAGEVGDE
jgi:pyruvate-ferredoxin/flavodoxin oxidoreductase